MTWRVPPPLWDRLVLWFAGRVLALLTKPTRARVTRVLREGTRTVDLEDRDEEWRVDVFGSAE